jgi:hypothetical protein
MKIKKETHVCPQCDSKNLKKSPPVDHKEEDVLEENPNDFLCEECGYYGQCPVITEDGKEIEEEDLDLHEIEEEKPKKEKSKKEKANEPAKKPKKTKK